MGRIQEASAMRGSGRLEMRMTEQAFQAGLQFGRERLGVHNAWSHREFVDDVKRLEPQFGVKTIARKLTVAVRGRGSEVRGQRSEVRGRTEAFDAVGAGFADRVPDPAGWRCAEDQGCLKGTERRES